MNRLILDVSNNNPITALELHYTNPVAIICKATEGISFVDDTYIPQHELCKKAHIPFGAYHFLRVTSDPIKQVESFLKTAQLRKGMLQPIIDSEDTVKGIGTLARYTMAFGNALRRRGYDPILYSSSSVWLQMISYEPQLLRMRVWEAQYPGRYSKWFPRLSLLRTRLRHGAHVSLWQWTDEYMVGNKKFDASYLFDPINELLIK